MNNLLRCGLVCRYQALNNSQKCLLSSYGSQLSHQTNASNDQMSNALKCEHLDNNFKSLISLQEIRDRHENLINLINKCLYHKHKPCVLLVPSFSRLYQADTKIPTISFKQNSDFIYLSGLNSLQSKDSVLALIGGNGINYKSVLFAPTFDLREELWNGPDIREHSKQINYLFDEIKDITELNDFIKHNSDNRQVFVSKSGLNNDNNGNNGSNGNNGFGKLNNNLSKLSNLSSNAVIHQLSPFIDQLRVIKSKSECDAMRRTCSIGAKAMLNTIKWTKYFLSDPNNNGVINESQIAAKFEFEARISGAKKLAFPTVCGASHNSTIIHYGSNNKFVSPNEWVLTDAGSEDIDGYNSDITRTWRLDAHYSDSHLRYELYEALCELQKDLIKAISHDSLITLDFLFQIMCNKLAKLLKEFNVIDKSTSDQEAANLAYKYCPHHVSHYLGLDIHDCPTISRNISLKPGMCFTIEPGLYFHKSYDVKPEFKGIGMRVEDDFLINSDGNLELLTKDCPQYFDQS